MPVGTQRLRAVLLLGVPLLCARSALGADPLSRSQIIELARPALGHAYHWGHGNWTSDGSDVGSCEPKSAGAACPECESVGDYGADASGFVAKAWQVPSASPVEEDSHPFDTEAFAQEGSLWSPLPVDRSDVRRGDAFVYSESYTDSKGELKRRGHVVLVDRVLANGRYQTLQAAGCSEGIITDSRPIEAKFSPLRRAEVTEQACSAESCSGRGECQPDVTCQCDLGYAGDHCERCLDGFTGYPTCVPASCPPMRGELRCGDSVELVLGSENHVTEYGCGVTGMQGGDSIYRFSPQSEGSATLRLSADEKAVMVLARNECDSAAACAGTSSDELTFEYGAGETYYVSLENLTSDVHARVQLSVECTEDPNQWIGAACNADSDCHAADGWSCYKHKGDSPGFCAAPCTKTHDTYACPENPNTSSTFCIADPANAEQHLCVARPSRGNRSCEGVPGTAAQLQRRFQGQDDAWVCAPSGASCVGAFFGRVVDALSGDPIAGAQIAYRSDESEGALETDKQGAFGTERLVCGQFDIEVSAEGYLPASVEVSLGAPESVMQVVQLLPLDADCDVVTTQLDGQLYDGSTDEPLADGVVELRAGTNAPDGDVVATVTTDEAGEFHFTEVPGGYYTLTTFAEGYLPGAPRSVALCAEPLQTESALFLVPRDATPETRAVFVLNWARPEDLDLHVQLPSGEEVFSGECAGTLDQFPFSQLRIEHENADGPEVITSSRLEPGTYTVFVHNASAQREETSGEWSETGATIDVYDGDGAPLQRFAPPTGGGNFWDALSFEGGASKLELRELARTRDDRASAYNEASGLCRPSR